MEKMLTTAEAAKLLGLAEQTLNKYRCLRTGGPRWHKIGRLVRYSEADCLAYLESCRVEVAGA